jgi:large subunit ribosomal protein L21
MTYAIIGVGGKQYRVREGEYLLVDRVAEKEGATIKPAVLLLGGDGEPKLGDDLKGVEVTALVAAHVLGKKIVVGKHRQRTGYRRRNGHRSRLTRIEIQSIGKQAARRAPAKTDEAEAAEKPAAKPKAATAAKPRAAKPKPKPKAEGKSE